VTGVARVGTLASRDTSQGTDSLRHTSSAALEAQVLRVLRVLRVLLVLALASLPSWHTRLSLLSLRPILLHTCLLLHTCHHTTIYVC
jgi:hypothetical protein